MIAEQYINEGIRIRKIYLQNLKATGITVV